MLAVKGLPLELGTPCAFNVCAICASGRVRANARMRSTVAAGWRSRSATGVRRVTVTSLQAPPCQRICSTTWREARRSSTVMSAMSSRSMRLRSFASVLGARHTRGRSRAKARILARCSAVSTRVLCAWNCAASALTSSTRVKASFQRRSRLAATSRLDGSTCT